MTAAAGCSSSSRPAGSASSRTGRSSSGRSSTSPSGSPSGGERGLLGLAFHPDYPTDPRFFVDYTDRDGNTVVVVSSRSAAPTRTSADPDSEVVLLHIDQPFANHNGGAVVFGPDGMLYIAIGDGGSGGDPQGNGQRLDTLLAKILRIDVDAARRRRHAVRDPGRQPVRRRPRARSPRSG